MPKRKATKEEEVAFYLKQEKAAAAGQDPDYAAGRENKKKTKRKVSAGRVSVEIND